MSWHVSSYEDFTEAKIRVLMHVSIPSQVNQTSVNLGQLDWTESAPVL